MTPTQGNWTEQQASYWAETIVNNSLDATRWNSKGHQTRQRAFLESCGGCGARSLGGLLTAICVWLIFRNLTHPEVAHCGQKLTSLSRRNALVIARWAGSRALVNINRHYFLTCGKGGKIRKSVLLNMATMWHSLTRVESAQIPNPVLGAFNTNKLCSESNTNSYTILYMQCHLD